MRITLDPAFVAENFGRFKGNAALQESSQLFARGLPVAEMVQALAMSSGALSAFAGFESIYPNGRLERGILEKVILCISRRNDCQFCVQSHLAIIRALGLDAADASDPRDPSHSERESLAIEYATAVHRDSNRVPEELYARLRRVFSDAELVELTFLTGYINLLNWFNNALGVRYRDEFERLRS